jgi:glycosyltransferase involved in cell wall biosynthesis
MRISVALCTYNGERFLPDQLASLAAQARPPDELIVCDDGSTDSTPSIVEAFGAKSSFPVHFHRNEKQLGFVLNFERAISLCKGDVIAPCDQDDVWYPDKLARFAEVFENDSGVGLVFCDADIVREDLTPTGRTTWKQRRLGLTRQQQLAGAQAFEMLLSRNCVSGNAMAFQAAYLEIARPFDPIWAHDHWVALLIAAVGRIQPLAMRLLAYRQHGGNLRGASGSVSRAVDRASHGPRAQFSKEADRHMFLRERLVGISPPRRDALVALVDGKIGHLRTRAGMSQQRLRRIPVVLAELFRGNYSRYARRGLLTAFRDVLW